MNCVKWARVIEVPFRVWTSGGPVNSVLDGGWDPAMKRGTFRGISRPLKSIETRCLAVQSTRHLAGGAGRQHAVSAHTASFPSSPMVYISDYEAKRQPFVKILLFLVN